MLTYVGSSDLHEINSYQCLNPPRYLTISTVSPAVMPPLPQTPGPEWREARMARLGIKPQELASQKLSSQAIPVELSHQTSPPVDNHEQTFPDWFKIPHRSPTPSEFGIEYHQEDFYLPSLPQNIVDFLDKRGLEAYFVPADGNCLFRALTFGPDWSKHDLARAATAAYIEGLKQDGNDLASILDDNHVETIRTDRAWEDLDVGQPQLKGLAEALKVTIEVIDAARLEDPPFVYSPQPSYFSEQPGRTQISHRPRKAARLMLYNLHYYPLFNKDTFYPRDPLPGKERMRSVEVQSEEVSPISQISSYVAAVSPSSDHTKIEEETLKPSMEKLWEIVNEKQAITAYKPPHNDLLSSEMSSKAPTLGISTKASISQDIASLTTGNKYMSGMNNNLNLKAERQPSSDRSVIVTLPNSVIEVKKSEINFWHGAAIGALGVGLAAFGAFMADFIFGRPGRKVGKGARERQINTSNDDIFVRAKW